MSVLTLQWASAKEVKCLASSSVNSGSISSHRTAKPLQPSCWSCLKRRACILFVQLIEKAGCPQTFNRLFLDTIRTDMLIPGLGFKKILLLWFTISHVLPRWYSVVESHSLIRQNGQISIEWLPCLKFEFPTITCLSAASTSSFSWSHSSGV